MKNINPSTLYLWPLIVFSLFIATTFMISTSYSIENNQTSNIGNITIPSICNDEKCMPQIFVSIPINQTQLNTMSDNQVSNLKTSYLKGIENYLTDSFNIVKSYSNKPIKPYNYCDTLPTPGCYGITPPPNYPESTLNNN